MNIEEKREKILALKNLSKEILIELKKSNKSKTKTLLNRQKRLIREFCIQNNISFPDGV